MRIDFHKNSEKKYKKLNDSQKKQFKYRLSLLEQDRDNSLLNNHALKGKYSAYRSMNVTGDIRAIFKEHSENHIEFIEVGGHSQLYK